MSVELNVKQQATLQSVIAWGSHPKNQHPNASIELARDRRSGWLVDDELLDHGKRGCDLALRGCA